MKIISVGKSKEAWLREALAEYQKRMKALLSLEFVWVQDDKQLVSAVEKERFCIFLEVEGKQMTSEEFSLFLRQCREYSGDRVSFVIGGVDGLPAELKGKGEQISLSKMTFTHQMARLILTEQIYRAFMIERGSPYHK